MKKHYLKVDDYNGYDSYYFPLKEDKTWKEVLSKLEIILDEVFCANDEKLAGMSVSFEIVDSLPEDCYEEDWK